MRQLISAMLVRQAAAVAVGVGVLVLAAALGFIALGYAAYAIYHHLLPAQGPAVAAWISGGIFLVAAIVAGAVGYRRLRRTVPAGAPRPDPQDAGPQHARTAPPDLALAVAAIVEEQLPKNAVPAALLALVAGVVVGLNPRAAQSFIESVTRKPS